MSVSRRGTKRQRGIVTSNSGEESIQPLRSPTQSSTAGRGASISAPTNKDLFSASTYLDDCITVALRRRKEDEGEPKCDGTDGKGSAESLRWRVRQVIESGGYVVVNDAKSQAKWMEGMMKQVQTALGCEYDFTDPLNPLIGTTSAKRQKALQLVEDLLGSAERTLDFKQVESTVGVLGDIAQVVLRGSTHLCGFYAAMREARRGTGRVPITAWLRRNLRWWQRYLHSGAPNKLSAVGLNAAHYGVHSLRIGGATAALSCPDGYKYTVKVMGYWLGDTVRLYTRPTREMVVALQRQMMRTQHTRLVTE